MEIRESGHPSMVTTFAVPSSSSSVLTNFTSKSPHFIVDDDDGGMGKDHQDIISAVRAEDIVSLQKLLTRPKGNKPAKISLGSASSKLKFNVNAQDDDGLTPLHYAALSGNVRIISLLLENGAVVNIPDKKGLDPLHYAAWQGYMDPVGLLLSGGADANAQSVDSRDTPLHLAAQHGHYDVVALLVQRRVDATLTNSNFKTALDLACEFGRCRVVDLLLQSDLCDSILHDDDGDQSLLNNKEKSSCLHLAAKNGHIDVIRLLLDAGVDINRQTMNGTCLHEAALCGKIDVVRLLLDYGVDVNRPNSFDQTALDIVNKFTTSRAAKDMKQLLREASSATQARAIHDFDNAFDPSSISFSKGEIVTVLEQNPDGHWKGFCSRDGQLTKTGFFPSAYVQLLTPEERGGGGGVVDNNDHRREQSQPPQSKNVAPPSLPSMRIDGRNSNDQPAYLQQGIPSKPVVTTSSPSHKPSAPIQQQLQQYERQLSYVELKGKDPSSPDVGENGNNNQQPHSGQQQQHYPPNSQYAALHTTLNSATGSSPVKGEAVMIGSSSRNSTASVDSGRSSAFKIGIGGRHGGGGSGISTSSSGVSSGVSSLHNGAGPSFNAGGGGQGHSYQQQQQQQQPLGHRLSYESSAGSSSRQSYHSSSSSLGSLDKVLEDSTSNVNVLDLFQKGCSDQEVLMAWLSDLRMDEYVNNFIHSGYDMPTITRMTPEDLTAIGVTKPGHRKKLKAEISQLNIGDGIPDYKPVDLLEWLTLLRLEGYYESLTQQGYGSIDDILKLAWEDLEEIGVSRLGHQKKLMLAIKYLQNPVMKKSFGGGGGGDTGGLGGSSSLERDKQQSSHLINVGSPLHHHHNLHSANNRHSACSNSSSNYSQDHHPQHHPHHRDSRGGGSGAYEDAYIASHHPPAEIVHLRQGQPTAELAQPDIVAIQVRNSGGSFRLSQVSSSEGGVTGGVGGGMLPPSSGFHPSHHTFHSPTRRSSSVENNVNFNRDDELHYGSGLLMALPRDGDDRDPTPTTMVDSSESHYSYIGDPSCHYAAGQPPPRTLSPCSLGSSVGGGRAGCNGAPPKIAPIRPRPVAKIVARTKASIHGEECGYEVASGAIPDFATLPRNLKVATADSGNYSPIDGGGGNSSPVPPSSPSKSPSGKRQPPPPPKRTNSTLDGGTITSKSSSTLDLDSSSLQKWNASSNDEQHQYHHQQQQYAAPPPPPLRSLSKETKTMDGDDSTQENFASCVQSLSSKFHSQTTSNQDGAICSNSIASPDPTTTTSTSTSGIGSEEDYPSQSTTSNISCGSLKNTATSNSTPNNDSGKRTSIPAGMRNPLLDSPGSICSLDCEDFPPPPPPLALEEFALVDVCKGPDSSAASSAAGGLHVPTQTVSVSKLAEKLDAKLSLSPRSDYYSARDIHHSAITSSSNIVEGASSGAIGSSMAPPPPPPPQLRLQHSAPSPKPKPSTTTISMSNATATTTPLPPNSPSRSNYVGFHFKENNASRPTAPVVPQPHRHFSQPSPSVTPTTSLQNAATVATLVSEDAETTITTTTTVLKPQVLGKPVLMRKPSPGGTRSSSSETLEDASSCTSSSSKLWSSDSSASSSQSNGSSPHSTLGRGDTLPFANENVGTIKQRNPASGKPSVLPMTLLGTPSPFDSSSAATGCDSSDEGIGQKSLTKMSVNSGVMSAATTTSMVGTLDRRRGGMKSVAQIPLDASLSSTIRRHSGLYPSSDEEGSAASLIPTTSYRQFIPTATSTTSVVTTASSTGSSDSDTSGSISSTGTIQRRPHLPTSALALEDHSSGDRTPERDGDKPITAATVVAENAGVSVRFSQPPPPPPPTKPERQQQRYQSAPEDDRLRSATAAEPKDDADQSLSLSAEGSNVASAASVDDIVDSTNVLNDIGDMLAGLTEELDAMLDFNVDDVEDESECPNDGNKKHERGSEVSRETMIT